MIDEEMPDILMLQEHWKNDEQRLPKLDHYTVQGFMSGHTKFCKNVCGG